MGFYIVLCIVLCVFCVIILPLCTRGHISYAMGHDSINVANYMVNLSGGQFSYIPVKTSCHPGHYSYNLWNAWVFTRFI